MHPANVQDREGAPAVLAELRTTMPSLQKVWADGGYRGPKLAQALAAMPDAPDLEIVTKPKEQKGFEVLPRRWIVERFFGWLGRCRRRAKDDERRLESSLAGLQRAVIRILVRRLGRAENPRENRNLLIMQSFKSCSQAPSPVRSPESSGRKSG